MQDPVVLVGLDAGASKKPHAPLRFSQVDSFGIPIHCRSSARSEWCEEAWKVIVLHHLDGIFADQLSPDEEYRTTHTPLDTVALLTGIGRYTRSVSRNRMSIRRCVCGLR